MKSILRLVAVVVMLGCFASPARTQTSSATISGHIVDQSGGVVSNAEIKLINQLTNVTVTAHTNRSGNFAFPDQQPGTFTVVVHGSGYKETRQVDLVLSASQNLSTGTIALQVGAVSETVTVSADITPLQTTSSERSGVLDSAQVDNLSTLGRDVMGLLQTLPGVFGGGGSGTLGTTGTPTVNGVLNEYNLVTVDGVTANTRGLSTMDDEINQDAVQQISLMGSNYQAAYGKTAGANITYVTKSGTNQYHGVLYYYFRNEDLNANSFFNKYNGANIARARYRYNTAGGTLGGPIFWPGHFNRNKDKLFFFVSYENDPVTSPEGVKSYRIPTQAEINGDFSQTYLQGKTTNIPLNIKNPTPGSGVCASSGTRGPGCFAGNKIPTSFIDPQMQILEQIIHDNTLGAQDPTAPAGAPKGGPGVYVPNNPVLTSNNYNYQTNTSAQKPVTQLIFRVDYFPTQKLHMFGRGDLTKVNNIGYNSTANKLPWLLSDNYQTSNPNFVFNVVYIVKPSIVNEFNVGKAGWDENTLYDKADVAKVTLGASGFSLPSLYSGVNPLNLFPATSFGGTNPANYGWDSRFPFADTVRTYSATDNVTWSWRNHTFKFGLDAQTDAYLQPNHNRVGTFTTSVNSNNPYDSNWGYANALMGTLSTYSQTTQLVDYLPRTNALEWYYQDSWKINSKLNLDLGIRNSWALAQRLQAGNNFDPAAYKASAAPLLYQYSADGSAAMDPKTGISTYPKAYVGLLVPNTGDTNNGIVYVNTPGYPQGTTYGNGILWAPRVGFAYSPTSRTVIRGGVGIFYNVCARSGQEGDLANNAPTTNSVTQYYTSSNPHNSFGAGYYAAPGVGNLSGPFNIGHALPIHSKELYTEQASIGVQHQFPAGIVLDIAYVGTFTKHASDYTPINEVPYGAQFLQQNQYVSSISKGVATYSTLSDNFFRPYAGLGSINMQNFNLTANYNSLQVSATRRFRNGFEFGAAWTYSRNMDYSDSYNGTVAVYQNLRAWNYGPAATDRRHQVNINYQWSLPKPSHLWNNFATRGLLDGWLISGFVQVITGAPNTVGVSISTATNITGGGDGSRAVLLCDPMKNAKKTFDSWFDTSCAVPAIAGKAWTPTSPAAFVSTGAGNWSPSVNIYDPGYTNFNTAVFKDWKFFENKATVRLRAETYNTFNHTEFNSVNTTASYKTADQNQSTTNPLLPSNYGQKNGTAAPRYMQLALRVSF
jgi:hypothetical protein